MKHVVPNVSIFFSVLLAMMLMGELLVRALYADQTVLFPRYHTDVKYGDFRIRRIRPNSDFRHTSVDGEWRFITNSQGFRNYVDFEYVKPENTVRILSLGDSHTQGYEVRQEHTFSAVLANYLTRHGMASEVINTGVSGFGTAEQLVLLENEGVRYQPDFVVLGFYANDFEDNIKAGLFRLDENGELQVNRLEHVPGVRVQNLVYSIPGTQWLSENSYFYSLLFNTTWEVFKRRLAESSAEAIVEYAVPKQDAYSAYEQDLAIALLKRIYEVSRQHGAKLIVIDIPTKNYNGLIESSLPDDLRARAREFSDVFIDSGEVLGEYSGIAELHVPNGHQHISEFAHTKFGVAAGQHVLGFLQQERDALSEPLREATLAAP